LAGYGLFAIFDRSPVDSGLPPISGPFPSRTTAAFVGAGRASEIESWMRWPGVMTRG